jgi:hypothetical protein
MKNMTTATSPRLGSRRLLSLLAGGLALGLAAFTSGLLAQNNDNGGILPGKGSDSSNASSNDTILAIDGQLEAAFTDPQLPSLAVSTGGYQPVGIAFGVSPEDAEFSSSGTFLAEALPNGSVAVQGSGTLNPEIGLELTLRAATEALARGALLVGSDAGHSLEDVLAGAVAPVAVVSLGDLPALDVESFHQLLVHHGDIATLRVSVVFVSIDAAGGQHLAAVSGLTGGTELELAFH